MIHTTHLKRLDRLRVWVINMNMKKSNGFTLIELMVVVTIVGILAVAAAPSFRIMLKNNRQATQTNSLLGALNLARSESIKRGFNVILCRSNDSVTCATNGGWEQGWLIFVDVDGGNDLDAADPNEEILRIYGAIPGSNSLTPNNNFINRVVYQPTGFTTQIGTFLLCDDRDGDGDIQEGDDYTYGRAIIINRTGRVRSVEAVDPGTGLPTTGFANCTG